MTLISYIIDFTNRKFYFFENNPAGNTACFAKQEELGVMAQFKFLKHYYGTVWLCYKWSDNGTVSYAIYSRWKDIALQTRKDAGYKIQKFVLTPYEEYGKPQEEEPPEMEEIKETVRSTSPF